MARRFRRFQWKVATVNKTVSFAGPMVIVAKAISDRAPLVYSGQHQLLPVCLEHTGSSLIADVRGGDLTSARGAWAYQEIPLDSLLKLCAFLDHSADVDYFGEESDGAVVVHASENICSRNLERWVVKAVFESDPAIEPLLAMIRTLEPYRLVRFLLVEHTQAKTVAALGKRYGLSKSHFSRLCAQVLGGGLKHELRVWRVRKAVLDVLERRDGMTTIAYENGFSSPSHFAFEVKQLLGISPRRFQVRLD
jgi:AraC-like DNA-binding protein